MAAPVHAAMAREYRAFLLITAEKSGNRWARCYSCIPHCLCVCVCVCVVRLVLTE